MFYLKPVRQAHFQRCPSASRYISSARPALVSKVRFRSMRYSTRAHSPTQVVTLPHLPELFDPDFLNRINPQSSRRPDPVWRASPAESENVVSNPLMDALNAFGTTNRVRTQNRAPALRSTESATLDAFLRVHFRLRDEDVHEIMSKAWAQDPSLTLRIIWYMRSIHEGKSDKRLFYRVFGWLYTNHPKTAIANLHLLVDPVCPKSGGKDPQQGGDTSHGYFKDLLNIVHLATVDRLGAMDAASVFQVYTPKKSRDRTQEQRNAIAITRHATLETKLQTDASFKALYIGVARIFAARLIKDLHVLADIGKLPEGTNKVPYYRKLTLAGKWAPTPGASHDRTTNISTAVALLLHHYRLDIPAVFPSSLSGLDYDNAVVAQDASILRSYFQRWVLTPLREALLVPETLMSAQRWKEIRYNRVPSICMHNTSKTFFKHDPKGFEQYLIDVESGKSTISGATLLPHEIIAQIGNAIQYETGSSYTNKDGPKLAKLYMVRKSMAERSARVAEAQWNTLVSRIRESGLMDNALAVCDVSGSMGSISDRFDKNKPEPIFSSIALSLLLASLTKPPFNGGFITFSEEPEFVKLDIAQSLQYNVGKMQNAQWGMNTDLNAVFTKLLLPLAKKHQIRKEDMIKRVFVFSDMQFDEAGNPDYDYHSKDEVSRLSEEKWRTNYDVIADAYKEAGYDVPEIIYWDLSQSDTVEVEGDRKGVAMMKGLSASMMKAFLEEEVSEKEGLEVNKNALTPISMMEKALLRHSFDGLALRD